MTHEPIAPGIHGRERLEVVRLHRLLEFERVFSLYLEGKVPASRVTERAKLMLEIGLPRLR